MSTVTEAIELKTTKNFKELLAAWDACKRRHLLEGGTSSAKTWSVLQFLIVLGQFWPKPLLISVVAETLPALKRGAIRDFFKILGESQEDNSNYSRTEYTYTFPNTGTQIEFFGVDNSDKVRGPRRDVLYIYEANNVAWETARGLDVRTALFTIADWNPTGEFWAHEYWIGAVENSYTHSTYLDALDVLPPAVITNIESNRDKDPNWWNIYGLGLLGKVEGLVYSRFEQVDILPAGFPVFYGLDFGYMVDPSALVANVIVGSKLYSQELFYATGYDNQQLARQMDLLKIPRSAQVLCDPDEQKSIDEIRKVGFNTLPSVKGTGSTKFTHQKVNQFYQFWTKDSTNCIKEQRNFHYIRKTEPGTGREYLSDDTTHQWSHGMSARRFAVAAYVPQGIIHPPVNNN